MSLNYGGMHRFDQYGTVAASLAPVAGTGSAQNGASVDRTGYLSARGIVAYSTSGGVTGGTIVAKIQHSADNSTWADFGSAVTATLSGTNPNGVIRVPADLGGANQFIRVVVDSDPTGGTPASIVAGVVELYGKDRI